MLRCNVEVSLFLEGAGMLVVGWVWWPELSRRRVRFLDGNVVIREIGNELVSAPRPDVLDVHAQGAEPGEVLSNDRPGFLAFIPVPGASRPKLAFDGADDRDALVVTLTPARFAGSLGGWSEAILKHHRDALVDLVRRHDALRLPAVRALLLATGLEPLDLEQTSTAAAASPAPRSSTTPPGAARSKPYVFEAKTEGAAGAIDHAFHVPHRGVFVVGWLLDPDDRVRSLHARCGTEQSPDLLPHLLRHERPDIVRAYPSWNREGIDRSGFMFLAELPGARYEELESSLHLEFGLTSGEVRRLSPPSVRRCDGNPLRSIREIMSLVPPLDATALSRHIGPAVRDLWSARAPRGAVHPVADVGEVPMSPDVSVVVPIYGRYDFIEYQMSLFADDPDWETAELIYVVDDPRIGDDALRLARQLYPLFRVSCRVVTCRSNNGFSAACNIGASLARGRLLLLLNSDVMPKRAGWLGELARLHDSSKDPGVVGAKLLFHDGGVQHAGMTFHEFPNRPGLWFNVHPGKGLPSEPEAPSALLPVPAVTGACMMLDRHLYLDVGGLDENYIVGDFEDSDLCLRLRERGRQCYCAQSVELFHLERQSQTLVGSTEWRQSLTLYNAWRQSDKWDDTIREIVRPGS